MITLTTFELFYFEVLAPYGIAKFQISTSDTSISLWLVLTYGHNVTYVFLVFQFRKPPKNFFCRGMRAATAKARQFLLQKISGKDATLKHLMKTIIYNSKLLYYKPGSPALPGGPGFRGWWSLAIYLLGIKKVSKAHG